MLRRSQRKSMAIGKGHLSSTAQEDERNISSRVGEREGTGLKEHGVSETEFKQNWRIKRLKEKDNYVLQQLPWLWSKISIVLSNLNVLKVAEHDSRKLQGLRHRLWLKWWQSDYCSSFLLIAMIIKLPININCLRLGEVLFCRQAQSHSTLQVGSVHFVFTHFNFTQFNFTQFNFIQFNFVFTHFNRFNHFLVPDNHFFLLSLLFFLASFFVSFFPSLNPRGKWGSLKDGVSYKEFFSFTHFVTVGILFQCLNFSFNSCFISNQKLTELHNHFSSLCSRVFLTVVSVILTLLITWHFLMFLCISLLLWRREFIGPIYCLSRTSLI